MVCVELDFGGVNHQVEVEEDEELDFEVVEFCEGQSADLQLVTS